MDSLAHQLPFFVYGTLLPGEPNFCYWLNSIESMRPAKYTGGVLYDMGFYPMLIDQPLGEVDGLLIAVRPSLYPTICRGLDSLEGFDPENPAEAEYRRVKRVVQQTNGRPVAAWVYVGRPALTDGRQPIGGNWKRYAGMRREQIEHWWRSGGSVPAHRQKR